MSDTSSPLPVNDAAAGTPSVPTSLADLLLAAKEAGAQATLYEHKLRKAKHKLDAFRVTKGYEWVDNSLEVNRRAKPTVASFFAWKKLCEVIRVQEKMVEYEMGVIVEREVEKRCLERSGYVFVVVSRM
jgi:hypothetical protein